MSREEMIEDIRRRYPSEGAKGLAKDWGKTEANISLIAGRMGVRADPSLRLARMSLTKTEKYDKLDLSIWEPLTRNGAYYLGLLWADGTVQDDPAEDSLAVRRTVSLTLSEPEHDLVFSLAGLLKLPASRVRPKKVKPGEKPAWRLDLSGRRVLKLVKEEYGIVDKKSLYDPPYPRIPDCFLSSFARGVFDGDGYPGLHDGIPSWNWLGSDKFLRILQEKICAQVGILPNSVMDRPSETGYLRGIEWAAKEDVIKLAQFLHQERFDNPSYLYARRKHDPFLVFL